MAIKWEIRCYGTSKEVNEIRTWYNRQSRKVQGKFQSRLKTLAQLELSEWKLPLFRWLHRECVPLGEVRFEVQNVQHRPLGFRSGEAAFTLTFCAQEQSDRFIPANACAIALERKAEITINPGRSRACWLALE